PIIYTADEHQPSPASISNFKIAADEEMKPCGAHGFHKFMLKQSNENANTRSKADEIPESAWRVALCCKTSRKPDRDEWGSGLEACQSGIGLGEAGQIKLCLILHKGVRQARRPSDGSDFIDEFLLNEQVENPSRRFRNLWQTSNVFGSGLGEYQFDKTDFMTMMDFIEENFLEEQGGNPSSSLLNMVTNLKRVGEWTGEQYHVSTS
ncbi:fts3-like protein, partial [Desmophyllum pertusum]